MIAWFARNSVAANLLMVLIVCVGLHAITSRLVLEIFPEFESDVVRVQVVYRGSTPAEVEQGILIKIEEATEDLVGVEEIRSSASEGSGVVTIEIAKGENPRHLLEDIKGRVDAISTFPEGVERPIYSIPVRRRELIGVVLSGSVGEAELRVLGDRVRNELLALEGITQVDLTEVRPYEIAIEVSEAALERYKLTFAEVSRAVSASSLDLPAGSLKTRGGEIRLRTRGQSYTGADFAKLVIIRHRDGARVTLGEIAKITDGFEEEPIKAYFNGEPCVILEVYRVGKQNALELSQAVRDYIDRAQLPAGTELTYWRDRSVYMQKRLNTLYVNAGQGALLVAIILGFFLRPSIAFWVCLGIPISFLGALALLPNLGVTINLLSVFGFILVLGIVVDDAIVTGENIYTHLQRGGDATEAVIRGAREVAVPVTFGVLTTLVAFLPLMFMGGRRGAFFSQIPYIVVPVLLFSLIESKLILPAHLVHTNINESTGLFRFQAWMSNGLSHFARRFYQPLLISSVWARYLTLSIFILGLVFVTVQVGSGRARFVFFPQIQSEVARASLLMPEGTSFQLTSEYIDRIAKAALQLREDTRDPETGESLILNILATAGSSGSRKGQSNIGRVTFEIRAPEERKESVSSRELVGRWRKSIGLLPGVRELQFRAEIGRGGDPVHIQLRGEDLTTMRLATEAVKERLSRFSGVFDIADSFQEGKAELSLKLKLEAESLGLTQQDLARQVRQGFFGVDIQRVQRGREDVRVTLRYPRRERNSLGYLERMKIRTSSGAAVPFIEVAEIERDFGFSTITRINRKRILDITADIDKGAVDASALAADIRSFLDNYLTPDMGITYDLRGEMKERRQSFMSLSAGLGFVLLATYILLAIPFKSYVQPLVVMSIIPFGWAGAVVGHQLLGLDLSIFSVLGLLALTGVVVNDSLVLLDFINRGRAQGRSLLEAVHESGVARFRAIILTSLTTFVGLLPLIFEKSTQAQFLIPMAVSLGFGILFSTLVTLFLVPVCYVILEDLLVIARAIKAALWD
jgi:multidrug efflux pump subunit AcrB